jgi:hypothetical protein
MTAIPQYEVRYMAGSCATGRGRSKVRWHAVMEPSGNGYYPPALCGQRPAIQWSDARPDQAVSCPKCLKKLPARPKLTLQLKNALERRRHALRGLMVERFRQDLARNGSGIEISSRAPTWEREFSRLTKAINYLKRREAR